MPEIPALCLKKNGEWKNKTYRSSICFVLLEIKVEAYLAD